MDKMINVVVFEEVKELCFMKCPTCKEDILITTDKWCKCKDVYKSHRKRVFKLVKDMRRKEGFSRIIEAEVKDFRRTTLKELEA